jgi:hypothetical protein
MEDNAAAKGTSNCFHGHPAVIARAIRGKRPEVVATCFDRWTVRIAVIAPESLPESSLHVEE